MKRLGMFIFQGYKLKIMVFKNLIKNLLQCVLLIVMLMYKNLFCQSLKNEGFYMWVLIFIMVYQIIILLFYFLDIVFK